MKMAEASGNRMPELSVVAMAGSPGSRHLDAGGSVSGGTRPPGGGDMLEARVARLESDVEYIRRDIGEMKGDLKEVSDKVDKINLRLAYAAGALFGGSLLAGWIISGKLDAILTAINSTP